ncbi:hypothetical protein CW702_02605 [Candidatus Bathyarchaeota archaeon]|nr:MAG: hypothetical protein CW702_02605 [Candidatus Bathyarchaeota archaeon]
MKAKTRSIYRLDIRLIEGEGDFPCPGCGVIISPDDLSEETYRILEVKTRGEALETIVIQCNRCKSIIHLVGFEDLDTLCLE